MLPKLLLKIKHVRHLKRQIEKRKQNINEILNNINKTDADLSSQKWIRYSIHVSYIACNYCMMNQNVSWSNFSICRNNLEILSALAVEIGGETFFYEEWGRTSSRKSRLDLIVAKQLVFSISTSRDTDNIT